MSWFTNMLITWGDEEDDDRQFDLVNAFFDDEHAVTVQIAPSVHEGPIA